MRYAQIAVLVTALLICLLSCRETIGERHDSLPKEDSTVPSLKKKPESPKEKKDAATPVRKPQKKEIKEKKQKASDTLKPKMAVLEGIE